MNFDTLMNQLRTEYVQELPEKIQHIANHMQQRHLQVVTEDFHKLKGTGTTYGIPEISQLAEVVERICIDRPEAATIAVPEALTILREIHSCRTTAQAFDISRDQRFSMLKRLVA
ncbi:MAG: Hpt domain-containing protein [Bdellovibrionales bacterium]